MITSIFSKSKPINFLIVFSISLIAFLLAVFKLDKIDFTMSSGLLSALVFLCCYLSVLVVDFIVSKNYLSLQNNYEVLFFSLFLLALPQTMLNQNIVFSNFFILLSLRRIVSLRTQKEIKKKLFDAGFLIAIASLFYFWAVLFFIVVFLALLFYAEHQLKNWIVPVLGYLSVVVITISISVVVNNDFFSTLNVSSNISFDFSSYNSLRFITVITMLLSFGLWSSVFYLRDIKKKKKTYRPSYNVIFVTAMVATLIAVLAPEKTGSELLFLFTPLTIVITNYIETITDKWFKEIFILLIVIIPFALLVLEFFTKG